MHDINYTRALYNKINIVYTYLMHSQSTFSVFILNLGQLLLPWGDNYYAFIVMGQ